LNPLPSYRLKHAKGHYFLFKLKREAVTLQGQEISLLLQDISIDDIPAYWYFSYYFSAVKRLLNNFEPSEEIQREVISRDSAKSLLQGVELLLLLNGRYETEPEKMVSELRLYHLPGIDQAELVADVRQAAAIIECNMFDYTSAIAFWYRVKTHFIFILRRLLKELHSRATGKPVKDFWKNGYGRYLKNWQYFAMSLLTMRRLPWRNIINIASVEKSIWHTMLWLLLAFKEEGQIDSYCITHACITARRFARVDCSQDKLASFRKLKSLALEYYPLGCAIMGI
jgi:hypothetical protein